MKAYITLRKSIVAIGAASALFAYTQVHKIDNKVAYIKEKLETNGRLPILELSTKDSARFPWEFNPESLEKDDWEFRRVQIKGGLFGSRHLVRRDRGDKQGYLVFAAMPTSQHVVKDLEIPILSEATIGAQTGIVVCLGWVPIDDTISAVGENMVQPDVVLIEDLYTDAKVVHRGRVQDPYTGFIYRMAASDATTRPVEDPYDYSDNPDLKKAHIVLGEAVMGTTTETDGAPAPQPLPVSSEMSYWGESKLPTYQGYYHMRGYLRKGDDDDWLLGRVNKGTRDVHKVDIAKIAGFYRFRNPSAYEYYIDRSTDDDKEYNTVIPQPNHLNKGFEHIEPFEKDAYYAGYKKLLKYASALAVLGLVI